MTLTRARKHALLLLEIQDAKRGWVKFHTLRHCGVVRRTLAAQQSGGLVECKPDDGASVYWLWRLTGRGEVVAAELKRKRDDVWVDGALAIKAAGSASVTLCR